MFQSRAGTVQVLNSRDDHLRLSDNAGVRTYVQQRTMDAAVSFPWALEMKAVSVEEPSHLVRTLTGAILACGGWVLSRGSSDTGVVNILFEFERRVCVDIYSLMIGAGLELSQAGHIRFTELCQCTRNNLRDCGQEIASVDLEIQTFPIDVSLSKRSPEIV